MQVFKPNLLIKQAEKFFCFHRAGQNRGHLADFWPKGFAQVRAPEQKIPVKIFPDEGNGLAVAVAGAVAGKIRENNALGKNTVLGLPTGNTPLDVYRELVRLHKEEGLDFSNAISFNLDEYYGMGPAHVCSYHRFMQENFFDHINIRKENIHVPDGTVARKRVGAYCRGYERKIRVAGGLDIVLLGIGRNGHLGFNESDSPKDSATRLVRLDETTRKSALPDFGEMRHVPTEAISMGVKTILGARQIILMATGDHKAQIVREAVEGPVNGKVVASYLQEHGNSEFFLDRAAASELADIKTPWLADGFVWDGQNLLKGVCHLSEIARKPICELTRRDIRKNGLGGILNVQDLPELRRNSMEILRGRIMNAEKLPKNKSIIVFSPHPDDDIISMGGTLRKLVENGNTVTVLYMTPGYTAVFDHAVRNMINASRRLSAETGRKDENEEAYGRVLRFLDAKGRTRFGVPDMPEVLMIKKIIREVEAISCCEFMGVDSYGFLNLPFYQTGKARKMPIGENDIEIVRRAIEKYRPDIIFAAGDLTDPNGTHRLCLSAIRKARELAKNKADLWLYSGAWKELHPADADVLVPLSAEDVNMKRQGIFRHESQKDKPPQPGHMTGEFWQLAEKRNALTAKLIAGYGLGGFGAMEAFRIENAEK